MGEKFRKKLGFFYSFQKKIETLEMNRSINQIKLNGKDHKQTIADQMEQYWVLKTELKNSYIQMQIQKKKSIKKAAFKIRIQLRDKICESVEQNSESIYGLKSQKTYLLKLYQKKFFIFQERNR